MRERREDRRKSFNLVWIGLLMIIIFSGLFFPEIPNINTYIGAKSDHNLMITKIKNNSNQDTYHKKAPQGIVISQGNGNPDKIHAYADKKGVIQFHSPKAALTKKNYVYVELKEENTPQEFAQSIDNAAIYVADLMHKYHINPDNTNPKQRTFWTQGELSKQNQTNPNDYFERYGYSSSQFFTLVTQYYYGNLVKVPFGLHLVEEIVTILRIIAIVVGISVVVFEIFLSKKRWLNWWDA